MERVKGNKAIKIFFAFFIIFALLLAIFFVAIHSGSIDASYKEIWQGLLSRSNENVNTIFDVRFPRIFIAILGGAGIAVSGVLLQAVMKNSLTDPGIIGISSAASLAAMVVIAVFPMLYFSIPLFSVIGGVVAYLLIYSLAWDNGASPTRLILVGVALNMTFLGISQSISAMSGAGSSVARSIVDGNIAQKSWLDVKLLAIYVSIFLILAFFAAQKCNLLSLDDQTARGLGVNVDRDRFFVALIGIVLASVTTSIVGVIGFLGLIVPHISRLIVGYNHKILLPFSALLGACTLLLSDTIGRVVAYPYEVAPSIIMAVVGGPFFIALLKFGGKNYGD